MVQLYTYTVTRQAQAFQIPPLENSFWESGQVCFKFTFCPVLIHKDDIVYLQSEIEHTLKAEIGDYLVYQHNELFFVKKKVFELKYKKYDNTANN
jgi:hypothetical protein